MSLRRTSPVSLPVVFASRYIAGEGREEQQWYGSLLMPGTEKDCAAYRFYEECCRVRGVILSKTVESGGDSNAII